MAACRSATERKTPRLSLRFVRVAKKPSTALSQEADVGVKWSVHRGWRSSHRRTFLMAMALHVATDHRAVEDVHRGEQRRRAVALIVVRHGSGATLLQRQSGLCAVKRLNLALFVDRQDDGVCGRIDIEPDDVAQFVDEARIVGQLERAHPVRLQTMGGLAS